MQPLRRQSDSGKSHELWIDVLKGIAIILVVYGHNCTDNSFVQAFHMPLFFLLSGFLFSPKPAPIYFRRSVARLVVPYIVFIIVISLPQLASLALHGNLMGGGKYLIIYALYGGAYLKGPYAVFWFVSVLWMSTNLFNLIISLKWGMWLLPVFIGVSYMVTMLPIPLPLNAHMVPLATSYIMIGNLIRRNTDWIQLRLKNKLGVCLVLAIAFLVIVYIMRHGLMVDMKYNNPGIPVISVLSSVTSSACVACIAIVLSRIGIVARFFAFLGEASMIIMFVHMPVKEYLIFRIYPEGNHLLSIVCGLSISIAAYYLLKSTPVSRRLFMGVSS